MSYSKRSLAFLAIALAASASFSVWSAPGEATTTPPPAVAQPEPYRVGPGDVLQVTVWREPEASVPGVAVRSDGRITLPLVKELDVNGLTPTEIEALITSRLANIVKGADVSVVVREVKSRRVFLAGAVKHEGAVPIVGPASVLQVITEAGGLTDFAKAKKIYILRRVDGKQTSIPFDYSAALKGKTDHNVMIQADDIIVVPR